VFSRLLFREASTRRARPERLRHPRLRTPPWRKYFKSAVRFSLRVLLKKRLADFHAAFADPENRNRRLCARRLRLQLSATDLDTPIARAPSQASLRLQRSHRNPVASSRPPRPSRLSMALWSLRISLSMTESIWPASNPHSPANLIQSAPPEGLRTLKPGVATGTLYGGCLSILVSLLGTPWEPTTEGKLLFLEDIGAKPYQIDACSGNCASLESSTASAASSSAKCSMLFTRNFADVARRRHPPGIPRHRTFPSPSVCAAAMSHAKRDPHLRRAGRTSSRICRRITFLCNRRCRVTTARHIHLTGICGTAMASLAGLLQLQGHRITGSDNAAYPP